MAEHVLKSWPEFYAPLVHGDKTFDLRKNDRNFQIGDTILMREWDPLDERSPGERGKHTGRFARFRIVHILYGVGNQGAILPLKGIQSGYCILGLAFQ